MARGSSPGERRGGRQRGTRQSSGACSPKLSFLSLIPSGRQRIGSSIECQNRAGIHGRGIQGGPREGGQNRIFLQIPGKISRPLVETSLAAEVRSAARTDVGAFPSAGLKFSNCRPRGVVPAFSHLSPVRHARSR